MRFREITGGLLLPVSNEEEELLEKIDTENKFPKTHLDEREQELARLLVSRGLLYRLREDDRTYYRVRKLQNITRD